MSLLNELNVLASQATVKRTAIREHTDFVKKTITEMLKIFVQRKDASVFILPLMGVYVENSGCPFCAELIDYVSVIRNDYETRFPGGFTLKEMHDLGKQLVWYYTGEKLQATYNKLTSELRIRWELTTGPLTSGSRNVFVGATGPCCNVNL